MPNKVCVFCGDGFYAEHSTAKYCSKACSNRARYDGLGRGEVVCSECGSAISKFRSKIKASNYCSKICKSAAQSKDYMATGNPKWAGGRLKLSDGYIAAYNYGYKQYAEKRRIREHRVVMERYLVCCDVTSEWLEEKGGFLRLKKEAVVHHVNGNRSDNRIDNLEVMSNAEHAMLHARERRQRHAV